MGRVLTKGIRMEIMRSPKVLFATGIIFIGFMACKTDDNMWVIVLKLK